MAPLPQQARSGLSSFTIPLSGQRQGLEPKLITTITLVRTDVDEAESALTHCSVRSDHATVAHQSQKDPEPTKHLLSILSPVFAGDPRFFGRKQD